jgi:hypothetical protein
LDFSMLLVQQGSSGYLNWSPISLP